MKGCFDSMLETWIYYTSAGDLPALVSVWRFEQKFKVFFVFFFPFLVGDPQLYSASQKLAWENFYSGFNECIPFPGEDARENKRQAIIKRE